MRIRKFMIIGVLSIVVFPWIVYFLLSMIGSHSWMTQNHIQQENLTQTMQMVAQNESNWTSSNWQHQLAAELQRQDMDVEIRSPSNQVIFESAVKPGNHHWSKIHHWMSTQQMLVMKNDKWVGTVQLFQPKKADPIAAIGAILACVLAIIFVSYQVGRNVIKPLESMSRAALRIAEGDLNFNPSSTNTVEIEQVSSAFQTMVIGLRDAFAKQQKLEEERRFFIGAIAHDLRSPLFSLRGFLDGMDQGIATSPDKIARYVAVCKEKAEHLDRLVSDLFAFTRLEYMEQTLQREHFNFSEIVNNTVAGVAYRAQEKGIVLDTDTSNDEVLAFGDPHLLERAVTNVLDNAIRYTPKEGKIKIGLLRKSDKIFLWIKDTGPGIPSNDLADVFKPLYRGDTSRNTATGGAGLGLTIARRVFRSHGGELCAENSPNGGAILTGWIPLIHSDKINQLK